MYPIIFQYKGLVISSYGLMLMLAFITCNYLLKQYLLQNNKDPKIAGNIVVSSNVKIHKKVLKMLKPALKK